ncbi:MAG: type VI secretion system-associated protein TagO [Candidatus Thermoplasmatota archaeon]|nr:type VI secretion system-associated protein TagO [Candidatus Thermoplasmatota archaeon]
MTLFLFAKEGKGSLGERVALALTCRDGVTGAVIGWWTVLGSAANVTWRVNDLPATTALWPLSADKTATSYSYDGIEFIQRLFLAPSLVAQVAPYGGSTITAEFDTAGLREAIQPLCKACAWPHSVTAPDAPAGPTAGFVGQLLQFSTSTGACSHGHPVELSFDWGAGTASEWSSASSWFKSWAREGTYHVRVRARCVSDTRVVSDWSEHLAVTVTRE